LSQRPEAWRQLAMEALNHYVDALYIWNLARKGGKGDTGFEVAYNGSHPLPQLRRMLIRLVAGNLSNPKLLIQTDRFDKVFTSLFDRDEWLLGKAGASDKASSQLEADAV